MAKIKYIAPSPKQGTIEHVSVAVANTLVAAGFAEHVQYKNYVERLSEESKLRTACAAGDAVVGMEEAWGVRDATGSASSHVLIIQRKNGETYFHLSVPKGCPKAIADKFNRLVAGANSAGANRAAIEKAQQEQYLRESTDRTDKYKVLAPGFTTGKFV